MAMLQKILGLLGMGSKDPQLTALAPIIEQLTKLAPQLANIPGLDIESIIKQLTAGQDVSGAASSLNEAAGQVQQGGDAKLSSTLSGIAKQLLNM